MTEDENPGLLVATPSLLVLEVPLDARAEPFQRMYLRRRKSDCVGVVGWRVSGVLTGASIPKAQDPLGLSRALCCPSKAMEGLLG